jgi:hypothetical protein
VRVRGLLAQLAEEDREITRRFEWQRGTAIQKGISRGGTSTLTDTTLIDLFHREEADRSSLRERWYLGLTLDDKAAVDSLCWAIAESVVRPHFPPSLPACLHGPMARVALEYAAIVRRATVVRQDCERRLANRNHTVVESILRRLAHDEEEAKLRLIGRWFRELTPEQQVAFDSCSCGDDSDWPGAGHDAVAGGSEPTPLPENAARRSPLPPGAAALTNQPPRPRVPNETTEQPVIDALHQLGSIGVEGLREIEKKERPTGERLAPKAIGRACDGQFKATLAHMVDLGWLGNGREHGLGGGYFLTEAGVALVTKKKRSGPGQD